MALKIQINALLTWEKNFQHILFFFFILFFCFAYSVFVLCASCTQGKNVLHYFKYPQAAKPEMEIQLFIWKAVLSLYLYLNALR